MRRRIALTLFGSFGALAAATSVHAQVKPSSASVSPTGRRISGSYHTGWTPRDGAPTDIFALAQTNDGYLWLGTASGLFRFDGVEFERYELPRDTRTASPNVSALRAMPDGTLWVGYRFGGISVIDGRRARTYREADGLPGSSVLDIARDSTGVTWLASTTGLYRLDQARWTHTDTLGGVSVDDTQRVLFDREGTMWVTNGTALYARARGHDRFVLQALANGPGLQWGLGTTATGTVWACSQPLGVAQLRRDDARPTYVLPHDRRDLNGYLLAENDSTLWLGTVDGIERDRLTVDAHGVRRAPIVERMSVAEGLTGNLVTAIFADREGNVWLGTEGGLDRFKPVKFERVELPARFNAVTMVEGAAGDVLIGSLFAPVVHLADVDRPLDTGSIAALTMYRDAGGVAWLGTENGRLLHQQGSMLVRQPLPREVEGAAIQAITRDRSGALWVSVVRRGVYRQTGGSWTRAESIAGLPSTPAISLAADSSGRVWLGYPANRLARYDGRVARIFTAADGLDIGNTTAIVAQGADVWIGGESGLRRLHGDHVQVFEGTDHEVFRGTSGIVVRENGDVWLNGSDGIRSITAAEVARTARDDTARVHFERFDARDGLDGAAPQLRPIPSARVGPEGLLWFITTRGLFRIDPDRLRRNTLPPPVHIRAVVAGTQRVEPGDSSTLVPNTRAVEIRYTALSLGVPDRVRFRYQLVGNDTSWQDGGARRSAFYTNLGPGTYTFRVRASNDDGVWNDVGDSMQFTIPRTFLQTPTFLVLCVLAALLLIWVAVQWRLRAVARGLRARYDERLAERTRIARDLHDTLLQGFTGITLQLEGVQHAIEANPADAAESLSRILNEADATLREARHAVWDMRAPELESLDLVDALLKAARVALQGTDIELRQAVSGERRRLPNQIEVAALRIGREAITNAVQHAQAQHIDLLFDFEPHALRLRICDDGRGFVQTEFDAAPRRGHWGVVGMRERAVRLGGALTINGTADRGTDVIVFIPVAESARVARAG